MLTIEQRPYLLQHLRIDRVVRTRRLFGLYFSRVISLVDRSFALRFVQYRGWSAFSWAVSK